MSKKISVAIFLLIVIGFFVYLPWPVAAQKKEVPATDFHKNATVCTDCHTCASPTKENPCLPSCPRTVPIKVREIKARAKATPPHMIQMDVLEGPYQVVAFDHKNHEEMAEMGDGCGTCHHYTPPGSSEPACVECHSVTPTLDNPIEPKLKGAYHRSCMGCHSLWAPDTECRVCHLMKGETPPSEGTTFYRPAARPEKVTWETRVEGNTVVTFFHDDHIEMFGLNCNECHRKESCRNCHDQGNPPYKFVRPTDEFHDWCNQCHSMKSCEWCHRSKEMQAFTHENTGWPLVHYHEPLKCQHCHKAKGKFTGLSPMCDACHKNWTPENFKHGTVTGVGLDEVHAGMDCGDCHEKRNFGARPTCSSCHEDNRTYPESKPGP